ncbi:MAG: PAS domain-containing protein [bacterium]|jgi:PAS domain S-box-containing protein
MTDKPPSGPDRVEVENAITNFKELISRLSGKGAEIGELYLSAERKAARYALLSENVIESVTSGIVAVDGQHEICLANSAAKRALGCDENIDLAGRQLNSLFEEHKQLEALVSQGFRSRRNSSRKVVNVTLHGGRSLCLGVSTSCVTYGEREPEAVIIVFTQLDRDATGIISGQGAGANAAAEAYRKGMLDAYGIVSEIYTDLDGLRAEIEKGESDVKRLAGIAGRVEFACDLMVCFALSKAASGVMTELVDLNGAIRKIMDTADLSGRRIVARLAPGLPRVPTLRRVLDEGLDMLLKGCLAESANGIEVVTRLEGPEGNPAVNLTVSELSPTLPVVEVRNQPMGFLEGPGRRREIGLMLLKSLPHRSHAVAVNRRDENYVYSVSFLMPKLKQAEKESTSGRNTDSDSINGESG